MTLYSGISLWPKKVSVPIVLVAIVVLFGFGLALVHKKSVPPSLASPPLKELAVRHGVELGNFAILNHMNDPPYRDILTSQFDFILADNTPNWYFTDGGLRPSPTTYNFKQMDEIVAYAETHHMSIEAHHLLWAKINGCRNG